MRRISKLPSAVGPSSGSWPSQKYRAKKYEAILLLHNIATTNSKIFRRFKNLGQALKNPRSENLQEIGE